MKTTLIIIIFCIGLISCTEKAVIIENQGILYVTDSVYVYKIKRDGGYDIYYTHEHFAAGDTILWDWLKENEPKIK